MNQLMWYYADLEKRKCYHASDELPDYDNQEKACFIWRRFAKYKRHCHTIGKLPIDWNAKHSKI